MWILNYDINVIWLILGFFTVFMVFFNGLIDVFEDKLPVFILEAFRYGKTLNGPLQSKLIRLITVPKSWFLHFYIFSSIYVPILLYYGVERYYFLNPVPELVSTGLDFFCTESRSSSAHPGSVLMVLILLSIQCFRRLYECAFVNAKSASTMNVLHYIVGFAHYFCAGTGALCDSPHMNDRTLTERVDISSLLTVKHVVLALVFLWAWLHQFRAHVIFSELKKNRPNQHSIPRGDLFEYVSSPHYLCEVIIYTVFMLIVGPTHRTMLLVWLWVLVNQTVAAWMSHSWYRNKFKEYPANRKAICPYIL